jgi:hypothetical protein
VRSGHHRSRLIGKHWHRGPPSGELVGVRAIDLGGEPFVGLPRAWRSTGSAIPGLAPTKTRRSTRQPSASAACNAIRPPIEYPARVNL